MYTVGTEIYEETYEGKGVWRYIPFPVIRLTPRKVLIPDNETDKIIFLSRFALEGSGIAYHDGRYFVIKERRKTSRPVSQGEYLRQNQHNTSYSLLGVREGASMQEIKAAYRQKAKALHPDVNPSPNAHEDFLQLQTAYDALRR
jgi:DnaJ-domain-containing protein 1